MKFYQELTLIPNDEVLPYFLWSKVYTQLHIAFADVKNTHNIDGIGVSFPQYRFEEQDNKTWSTLGLKLRVFAQSEDELNKLNLAKWLDRLTDYVHLKSIQTVPENHHYAIFKRFRFQNIEKVAQRFAKHKNIDYKEALQHCRTHKVPSENYPFIELKSETTKHLFKLSIIKIPTNELVLGEFNLYGLGTGSVPDF